MRMQNTFWSLGNGATMARERYLTAELWTIVIVGSATIMSAVLAIL